MVRTSIGLRQKNTKKFLGIGCSPWFWVVTPLRHPFRGRDFRTGCSCLDWLNVPNVLQYYVYYNIAGQFETVQPLQRLYISQFSHVTGV